MVEIEQWLPKAVLDSTEYRIARTHCSAGSPHNERQEFLGDALLGLVISEILYERFPDLPEGDLTRLRSHLVCRSMLGKLAVAAQLDEILIVDTRQSIQPRARRIMAGNALEAVIAAVYQVCGLEEVHAFIRRLYGRILQELPSPESLRNAKATLQELLQAHGQQRPSYTLVKEQPEQSPRFEVLCEAEDLGVKAQGTGDRIREAEQSAAAAVIAEIQRQRPEWTL